MFCKMFGFNRKEIIKLVHCLIQENYGTYVELTNMTLLEVYDILKTMKSIEQEETLMDTGL